MIAVFIVIALAVTVAVAVVLIRQPHPEDLSSHIDDGVGDTQSARFASDRPAGPDAEDTGMVGPGQPAPDPDIAQTDDRPPT